MNGWFHQEGAEITEEKNSKYRSMIQRRITRAAREEYSEARMKEKGHIKRQRKNIMKNNFNGYKTVILERKV
jgi:hypothetical protein